MSSNAVNNNVTYATLPERLAAALIDYLIIATAFVTLVALVSSDGGEMVQVKFWHIFAIEWLYFSAQHSSQKRATLGMRVMKLQITTLNAKQLTLSTASLRYMVSLLSSLILWLGHLMMLTNDLRQTMHDKMAGTLVIKKQNG
ncbi:MAG: RDD family protein [Alphaproteobacteria bacterium]|nr:RDD family protein [Alphaproteobacteria bacterium]